MKNYSQYQKLSAQVETQLCEIISEVCCILPGIEISSSAGLKYWVIS